ncbi:TPA: hypothetical protein DEP96_02545 [Candidatus Uhrbacteria bacterium]|nr:hypothetical protein [Candidatus Uhrbacteria bacterium]
MSDTQTDTETTPAQSTPASDAPADVLPNREDLVAIANLLSADFRYRESLVREARVHGTLTSPQVRFRDLCKDLNVQDCPELNGLTKHGLRKNWQFAVLSPTMFAELVPDWRERKLIESFMTNEYGLFHDTAFSERMLRNLQGRPTDITANKAMLAVLDMTVEDFVNQHNGEFNEVTRRYLAMYYHVTVLWYLCHHRSINSTRVNVTTGTFGQALAKHGLWLDLTPTPAEQKFFDARENAGPP